MATALPAEKQYGPPWIGVGWMVVTGLLFVAVTGIVRYVGSDVPATQAAFLRYVFGIVFIAPFLWRMLRDGFSRRALSFFAMRGFIHALGVSLWFFAMARIPIAEVTAIGYTAPIYITIGAALFFGERLAARRILAVVAAFAGALLILRPGFQEISLGQLAQICSAPMFAISYLMAKRLSDQESPTVIVGMLTIFVTIALAPMAAAVWVTPSLSDTIWLAVVALVATLGHITMTKALHAAPLMVTQPVTFLQLVWATILGVTMFGEAADVWVLAGGGVIIAAVSFISYREWVVSRQAATPPAAATK